MAKHTTMDGVIIEPGLRVKVVGYDEFDNLAYEHGVVRERINGDVYLVDMDSDSGQPSQFYAYEMEAAQ